VITWVFLAVPWPEGRSLPAYCLICLSCLQEIKSASPRLGTERIEAGRTSASAADRAPVSAMYARRRDVLPRSAKATGGHQTGFTFRFWRRPDRERGQGGQAD
jgi:hypothetical protein